MSWLINWPAKLTIYEGVVAIAAGNPLSAPRRLSAKGSRRRIEIVRTLYNARKVSRARVLFVTWEST